MILNNQYFTSFKQSIESYTLPDKFTFPFFYQPHPLCILAAKELQHYLETQTQWQHNFGHNEDNGDNDQAIGKMFGVLLVKNKANDIGYLAGFSGKLAGKNNFYSFVPPIFDMLEKDGFFLFDEEKINHLNKKILKLENNPQLKILENLLHEENEAATLKIKIHRELIIAGRKKRKSQRLSAEKIMDSIDFQFVKNKLAKQSVAEKIDLRDLKLYWDKRIEKAHLKLTKLTDEINLLKNNRKALSSALQNKLFNQYHFLNIKKTTKSLVDIFKQTPRLTPPAGAGECATPKLLQYAFQMEMTPLAMAEFWWGRSPKSEIRKHQNFYPACKGKCEPILKHMLEGIEIDDNPLLSTASLEKKIETIYEDKDILVINKPSGLLSVPGKNLKDSVYTRIKKAYPDATGPLTVHRLDMATSGLLLIALSKQAHKNLQKQFINRSIKKRYIALLEGLLTKNSGVINLPLRNDLEDRPRQLVCYEKGKKATTKWQVIERKNNTTRVQFFPITGRTHQLRVHAAHLDGLDMPIIGDAIYGNKSHRLCLHAEYIEFKHPITKQLLHFELEAEF
jgi:tRNA pseudouridine32 synthase/23S rRNA pseudouridine746 synthase